MLFSAVTVNLNKIGFNFTTEQLFFINRITLRFWRALLRVPLLLYGAYIWWTPMDGFFSTAILIIPCVWLGIAVQNPNTPFWDIYRYRFAMRFCRCELCFEHGQYQFLLPKSQTREPTLGLMAD